MRRVEKQIRASIDSFVSELNALVRQAAVDAVQEALGATAASKRSGAGGSSAKSAKAGRAAPVGKRPARRRRRSKRSPRTLARLENTLLGEITRTPGQRIEAIGKRLGIATKDLNLPIKRLIEAKKVKKRGEKRATEYLPG